MLPKTGSFGQRTSLRQPTIVTKTAERAEPAALVSHAATPMHAPVSAPAASLPAVSTNDEAAPAPAPAMAMTTGSSGPDARWAKRTASRLGAQVLHESLAQPIACTVRDTSSTGARLEVAVQRGGNISRDRIPDQFTLFMPADRLEVDCQVMWRQGAMVGVRYSSPARRTAKPQPIRKPDAPKKPHTSLINLLINPL